METILPKIPCGDQLREAWLEAVDLHHRAGQVLTALDKATNLANDENCDARIEAKVAKEAIHGLTTKALVVRDMITIWQAWASDNSSIE